MKHPRLNRLLIFFHLALILAVLRFATWPVSRGGRLPRWGIDEGYASLPTPEVPEQGCASGS